MKDDMKSEKPVFIDLRTDFGFKRCFGDEKVMKRFLNLIFDGDYCKIESLVFENVEEIRQRESMRGVTFDLRCTLDNGDEVIVEMQNYGHRYFQTRANYYLYSLLDQHIKKGNVWSKLEADIPHLIGVFILGVPMKELKSVVTRTAECDLETKEIFWDRMRKYFISLPNFTFDDKVDSLSDKDIWIGTIKNLGNMEQIDPTVYERADDALKELIDKARVSALSDEEYRRYEAELKILSDEGTAERYGYDRGYDKGYDSGYGKGYDTGYGTGVAAGKEEGFAAGQTEGVVSERKKIILQLRSYGMSDEQISEALHLPKSVLE